MLDVYSSIYLFESGTPQRFTLNGLVYKTERVQISEHISLSQCQTRASCLSGSLERQPDAIRARGEKQDENKHYSFCNQHFLRQCLCKDNS